MVAKYRIQGPSLTPLPRRLLDLIPRIEDVEHDRWTLSGATFAPNVCNQPILVGPQGLGENCTTTGITDPNYEWCTQEETQLAFALWDVYGGDILSDNLVDVSQLEERLRANFSLMQSWAFARELLSGDASTGMSLSSEATAPAGLAFGSAATPLVNAFAVLETELAVRLRGARGIIHLAPGLLAAAVAKLGLTLEGEGWHTPLGNLVIADAGYVDAPPPDGSSVSADGQDWVYASGPVEFGSTAPDLLDSNPNQRTNITNNKVKSWMSSSGILIFDPCPVSAVLASYPQS